MSSSTIKKRFKKHFKALKFQEFNWMIYILIDLAYSSQKVYNINRHWFISHIVQVRLYLHIFIEYFLFSI